MDRGKYFSKTGPESFPFQAIRFAVFSLKHIRYNHRKDTSQQDGKHFTFPTEKAPVPFRRSTRQTEGNKCLYGQQALLAFQLTPDSTPTNAYLQSNQGPFATQLSNCSRTVCNLLQTSDLENEWKYISSRLTGIVKNTGIRDSREHCRHRGGVNNQDKTGILSEGVFRFALLLLRTEP